MKVKVSTLSILIRWEIVVVNHAGLAYQPRQKIRSGSLVRKSQWALWKFDDLLGAIYDSHPKPFEISIHVAYFCRNITESMSVYCTIFAL